MLILESKNLKAGQTAQAIEEAVAWIDQDWLRSVVERISIPRNYEAQPENNRQIAEWVEEQFQSWGYQTIRQG